MDTVIIGKSTGVTNTESRHPSGAIVKTSWPNDAKSGGDGLNYTPVDLFVTGVATCEVTTLTFFANKNGINVTGVDYEIRREIQNEPRRILNIEIDFKIAGNFNVDEFERLKAAAKTCTASKTLVDTIDIVRNFTHV